MDELKIPDSNNSLTQSMQVHCKTVIDAVVISTVGEGGTHIIGVQYRLHKLVQNVTCHTYSIVPRPSKGKGAGIFSR